MIFIISSYCKFRGEDKDVRITECPDIRSECLSGCLCGCPELEIFFPLKFFSFFFFACRQKILQNFNGFHLKPRTSTQDIQSNVFRMSIECLSNVFADVFPSVNLMKFPNVEKKKSPEKSRSLQGSLSKLDFSLFSLLFSHFLLLHEVESPADGPL